MNTIIESENIIYKPITVEDTDMVLKWRNSEAVKSNFIYKLDVTREDHLNWLENKVFVGKVKQFVMCEKETGIPFGSVYLKDVDYEKKEAEFGIFIGEAEYRGMQFGTEAAARMVKLCLEEMQFDKLYLRVLAKNEIAKKAYNSAGFAEDYKEDNVIFMSVHHK